MQPTESQNRLVYVVDDDEAVRDSTCWLLKSVGIVPADFSSADLFLEHFEPTKAGCILLDLHMPGLGGLELLELIRAREIGTPVIVISGRRDPLLDEMVRKAGAMAILSKPSSDEELLALVQHALTLSN